jgi:hypothetical protein
MKQLATVFSLLFAAVAAFGSTPEPDSTARPGRVALTSGQFSVHVFPNPTPGPLVVQIDPLHAVVDLVVFDAQRHAVLTVNQYSRLGSAPLDLKHLAPGRYRLEARWNGVVQVLDIIRAVDPVAPTQRVDQE